MPPCQKHNVTIKPRALHYYPKTDFFDKQREPDALNQSPVLVCRKSLLPCPAAQIQTVRARRAHHNFYLLSIIFFSSHCSAMRRNSSSMFAGIVNATRTVCGSVCRAASISPAYYTSVSKKAMYRGSVRICSSRPTL